MGESMQDLGLDEYFHIWVSLESFLGLDYLIHCNWYIYRSCNTKKKRRINIELFLLKS